MNWGKGYVFLLLAAVAIATVASSTVGVSSGINRPQLKNDGCICHGPNKVSDGKPNPNVNITVEISGNPLIYEGGKDYYINFSATSDVPAGEGNKGGFNLWASAGTFTIPLGWEEFIQVRTPTEATHTAAGDSQRGRNWSILWKAPANNAESVTFRLFMNTVNGDASNDDGDHWGGRVFVLLGKNLAVGGGEQLSPEQIGVRWLAHWVGIISFVAVFATLLIYYFVLKYGETMHATDHRDRKEK